MIRASRVRQFTLAAVLASQTVLAQAVTVNQPAGREAGTTIVGEQESAIGLNLTPWKDESAGVMDLPPALFNQPATPVNGKGFSEYSRSSEAIHDYRHSRLQQNW